MSMYPFFIEYEQPRRRPQKLFDQHFGMGLTPQDQLTIIAVPRRDIYNRPWKNLQAQAQESGSTIKEDKDKYQINLDVQHFSPEEISVKTADGYVIIEAKHEEREDEHGFISRSFVRKYPIPEGVDPDSMISKLSSDGVLSITAPLNKPKLANERIVPIVQTGPVKKQEGAGEQEKE